MKTICIIVDINLKNQDIINYSGRSISIIFLFQKDVSTVTTMSLIGYKKEALSLLINNVGILPLKDSETSNNSSNSSEDLNDTRV
ncbi:7935_t:CDS:2 [Cetraspora pellucida]|uniref:7935_t:CDS:1 n=1 Tax=Cetraspora pellucida TaxID=1433469 RepID=A0A9N9F3A6_9GLOM|nr:7935_t:CDS:2 [Cetraspora pellucida]